MPKRVPVSLAEVRHMIRAANEMLTRAAAMLAAVERSSQRFPSKAATTGGQQGLANIPTAAAFLGVSRSTVYRMIESEEIESVPIRGSLRIRWDVLHKFVDGE